MTVWVVRAGSKGEGEDFAIEHGKVGIDFGLKQSIADFNVRDDLRDHLAADWNDGSVARVAQAAGQIWNFKNSLQLGDLIVLPLKKTKVVAVGTVTGDYEHLPDLSPPHTRRVEWMATDIPRTAFDQDLLYSIGGLATVFRVGATDAERRVRQIVEGHSTGLLIERPEIPTQTDVDLPLKIDLQEQIEDRIVERIRQRFSGGKLESLVASILRSSGYNAIETRPGPDGGIDIVAGRGDLGFGQPRLCVQVKTGRVDLPEYQRLQANIRNYGADHGLLVSLGDFTRQVRIENERSFFQIRLWGPNDIVTNLLQTYDSLPSDMQRDIPLRDSKILVEEDA